MFDIPVKGTHAHAYITSFTGFDELKRRTLSHKGTGELSIGYVVIVPVEVIGINIGY